MIKESMQVFSPQNTIQSSTNNLAKNDWGITFPIQQQKHLLFTNNFNQGSLSTPPLDEAFPVPTQTPLAKPKSNV